MCLFAVNHIRTHATPSLLGLMSPQELVLGKDLFPVAFSVLQYFFFFFFVLNAGPDEQLTRWKTIACMTCVNICMPNPRCNGPSLHTTPVLLRTRAISNNKCCQRGASLAGHDEHCRMGWGNWEIKDALVMSPTVN